MTTLLKRKIMLCSVIVLMFAAVGSFAACGPDSLPYQDPNLPVKVRVSDLVSRMTREEKISQLGSNAPAIPRLGVATNDYWNEALHGVMAIGATSFPQAIALSSTWNGDLIHRVASAISDEARVIGRLHGKGLTYWCPVINMARDPRWGRTEETYGEDPYLAAIIAGNFIRGMQGSDHTYLKTVATVKHFACNNVDDDRHRISSQVDERSLMEYYLPAFKYCVKSAGVYSVMSAYNALNGVPCPVNRRLLANILRKEWGFPGFVVSDCDAVSDVYSKHEYVHTAPDATALSIRSGTDLNCGGSYQYFGDDVLQNGLMDQEDVDTALTRILTARFLLGEFDPPAMVPYTSIPDSIIDCRQHRDLALLAAKEAIVLLKNDNAALPLNPALLSNIAVIGPNASMVQLGGYSGFPTVSITPLQGIINAFVRPGKTVSYAQGCSLYGPLDTMAMNYAVAVARNSEVAILVCGTDQQIAHEEKDRTSLDLPWIQDTLIQRVLRANPRTIVVLVCGFPLSVNRIAETVPGIILAMYDGQAQGEAVADVLFGAYNPGGKLSATWYRTVDDLPPMNHYDIKENRTYQYFTGVPLYPFGFGLSYTTFEYSNMVKDKTTLNAGDSVTISVTILNTGSIPGDEVVQFYVHHADASIKRPGKELKGFRRITLQPGERKTVTFCLKHEDLAYYDETSKSFLVNNGSVDIMLGSSSEDIRLADQVVVNEEVVSLAYRLDPLSRMDAEDFEKKSKPLQVVACSEGGQSIRVMADNDFLEFRNVDFGTGVTMFDTRFELDSNALQEGTLEIRLDSLAGPVAGSMVLRPYGRQTGYEDYSCLIDGAKGVRDLYLVFKNAGDGFFRMNWFTFRKPLPVLEIEKNDIRLYPNPASAYFCLTGKSVFATDVGVEIFSLQGTLVWSCVKKPPLGGVERVCVDLADAGLSQGMYIVRCTVNNESSTCKLCVVP